MLRKPFARKFAMAVTAAVLGGCTNGHVGLDPTGWFSTPDSRPTSGAEGGFTVFEGSAEAPRLRATTAADLVGPDGTCQGAPAEPATTAAAPGATPAATAAPVPRGIGLTMTECQLVAVAGAPDQINIGTKGGGRQAVLTYTKGDHPGIYTFVSGRLKVIERLPAPPKPEPRRRRSKKQRRA